MFKKAQRHQAKLRLALCGTSGSGKTYSALLLAKGLGGKVALLDTERGSASLYSHLFEYDVCELNSPFTPARYISIIKQAEKDGYTTLIIDSLSHAWSGEGGILDMQDKAAKASRSQNTYFAWREVTPEHNKLVDTILQSPLHIICCMRSKTSYEVVNEGGKAKPIKVGLAPIQREGLEYEFTVVLDLASESHIASASKDRTNLFDNVHEVITEDVGEKLMTWLSTGDISSKDEYAYNESNEMHNQVLEKINECEELDKLKDIFTAAYKLYHIHPEIMKEITEAKDKRKQQLEFLNADNTL